MGQADTAAEIEAIKSVVGKYFPIYDIKVTNDSLLIYVNPDPVSLKSNFEKLRTELGEKSYIPFIEYKSGEHIIQIARKPEIRRRGIWINWLLLAATFVSTVVAGAYWWASYSRNLELFSADNLLWGALFFAIPLMSILGAHELSHFLMSRRYGIEASLPFFIPSIPPLGTFGAFISMRDPMPDRKALVDIGVAGPLGGLLVTIPVAVIGLFLTSQGGVQQGIVGESGTMGFMMAPLFELLTYIIPIPSGVVIHPMAFAAWVGMFVTAMNLLPAGQLDGGHIARGLLGEKARYLSYATIAVLFIMSLFYVGWMVFGFIILFLGLKHPAPLNDISKIDIRRKVVGAIALVVLVATFTPIPVVEIPADHSYEINVIGSNTTTVALSGVAIFNLTVSNTGNTDNHMQLNLLQIPSGWAANLSLSGQPSENATSTLDFVLPYRNSTNVTMQIVVSATATPSNIVLQAASNDRESVHVFRVRVS